MPAVLKDFYAQNGGTDKIVLKWVFNNTENLTGVYICYQAGEYPASPNDGAKVVVDNYTTLSIDVENLENGVEYFFRAYPYREIDGVKYFQTCNEACKTASTPNDIIIPADLEVDGQEFVEIPKCSWRDLGIGDSNETFPAFIIDEKEVDSIFIGKYGGSVENNKAVSKKGLAKCQTSVNKINDVHNYCKNIGTGWHPVTRLEWMAIALWSIKNNIIPISVNDPYAGAGDVTSSHNGTEDGIYDMNLVGTVYNAGIRLYNGELQIISRKGNFSNDGADLSIDQTNLSRYWWAIDGTTGDLIVPDGTGTTENSIKKEGAKWGFKYNNSIMAYETATCVDGICEKAKNILMALGFLPLSTFSTTEQYVISSIMSKTHNVFAAQKYLGGYIYKDSATNLLYFHHAFYMP